MPIILVTVLSMNKKDDETTEFVRRFQMFLTSFKHFHANNAKIECWQAESFMQQNNK